MKHWEFLLQKEGDRSWLSLDAPSVEILEGRYRMVARCDRPDTPVSMRICHTATEQDSRKRRIQQRDVRTNASGLMVMIPFTRLEPGGWEFQCTSSDAMSDLVGDGWRYTVQLQVLRLGAESEEWEPDWADSAADDSEAMTDALTEAAATEPDVAALPESAHPPIVDFVLPPPPPDDVPLFHASLDAFSQLTEQMSDQLLDEVMADFDWLETQAIPEVAPLGGEPTVDSAIVPPPVAPQQSYASEMIGLTLTQEAIVANQSEPLTLTGRVELADQMAIRSSDPPVADLTDPWTATSQLSAAVIQELQLELNDPQSLEVLVRDRLPIAAHSQPFTFTVMLPSQLSTRLIVGEVRLCGLLGANPTIFASQTFTITANPTELGRELAKLTQAIDELPPSPSAAAPDLDLSFLDLAVPAPTSEPSGYSLHGQPLPPQLHQPDLEQWQNKPIDLPSFNATEAPIELESEAELEVIQSLEGAAAIAPESSPSEAAQPPEPVAADQPGDSAEIVDPLDQSAAFDRAVVLEVLPALDSPADTAFQSLNFQDRFLNRLSAIANDSALGAVLAPEGAIVPLPLNEAADYLAHEVVVSDDLVSNPAPALTDPTLFLLPEDAVVPIPELYITAGELIAGQLLQIRVKLPTLQSRIYVKLWVNDRQTRTLLDPPRWLVDFAPDGHGALEAITQMSVPFGSVGVRFEAIAVEVQTQRESHKAMIDRPVIPPDLPTLSANPFDA